MVPRPRPARTGDPMDDTHDSAHREATKHLSYEQERARDPKTPLAGLLQLAQRYPDDVEQNPALPLLALEDPEDFLALQLALVARRISRREEQLQQRASPSRDGGAQDLRLAHCDCLERALPLVEARHPGEQSAHRALDAARRMARGALDKRSAAQERKALSNSPLGGYAALSPLGRLTALLKDLLTAPSRAEPLSAQERLWELAQVIASRQGGTRQALYEERKAQLRILQQHLRRDRGGAD